MPNLVRDYHSLWEHTLSTPGEVAYANERNYWSRAEGPLPFRVGDLIRLHKLDMDEFVAGSGCPLPSLLERRRLLPPVKCCHVITPKALP